MWEQTYNRLIEILYGPDCSEEDLKAAIAIASISAIRRGEMTSDVAKEAFYDAIRRAVKARKNGEMPPDDLKTKIRGLFLNS
ncbi:hypothetical protein [Paracoccus methylarcula]|uniref:Uncharacterized protein n=1 Tax=Paracoccus methylarcula TaxID=72022 RepID=A0A3R7N9X9_9RHOB|nr:hypothetical protein [Paracoccus methylarcula]RNF32967.1 hypothetical protein A7A09_019330 [Paracoccus methylarcula]